MSTIREVRAILNWHLGWARYLLIHIPKNAGVSLRKEPALARRIVAADPYFHINKAYTRAVAQRMAEDGEHHGFQHARWRDIHPKVSGRLRAVGIVRNPWSRTVSRWRFAKLALDRGKIDPSYVSDSFEGFLEERHRYGNRPYYWHRVIKGWYPQVDYVLDEEDNLRVDLLRFEELDVESARYFGLNKPICKRNVSGKQVDYRDFYTERTIQIVAEWYARDIDFFGFDFDTSARRNVVYAGEEGEKPSGKSSGFTSA